MTSPKQGAATPWQIIGAREDRPDCVQIGTGYVIATVCGLTATESREKAALIVRAVNSHDALVEALRLLLDSPELEYGEPVSIYTARAKQIARAALAAAGQPS